MLECIKNKLFVNFVNSAYFQGIVLSNDPEKDYSILKKINKHNFEKFGMSLEEVSDEKESVIGLKVIHNELRLVLREKIKLKNFEINSPQAFYCRRSIYEELFSIFSTNDISEYKLFGPNNNAKFISQEFIDQNGIVSEEKCDKKILERAFADMTNKEALFTRPKPHQYREFSWSDIKLYLQCPRCFYFSKEFKTKPPVFDSESFALPNAVDSLLKKEFDLYRKKNKKHSILDGTNNLRLLRHKELNNWRNAWDSKNKKKGGVSFKDVWKNSFFHGGVDDLWINEKKEIVIVESKTISIDSIKDDFSNINYLDYYKKQVEFYAWLFKKNNYDVAQYGYIVFYNALKNKDFFDFKLEFKSHKYVFKINDSWIEPILNTILDLLNKKQIPMSNRSCKTCKYQNKRTSIEKKI